MTWVFEHSQSQGSARLVLLAIADRADEDGHDAWPSLAWLASKAKVSERTVRRALRELEAMGELRTGRQRGGSTYTRPDRRPNAYQIVMKAREDNGGTDCPVDTPRGDNNDRTGGQMRPDGGSLVSAYTSFNHPDPSAAAAAPSGPAGRMDEELRQTGSLIAGALKAQLRAVKDPDAA